MTVLLAGGFAAKAQADGLNAWGLASISLLLLLCASHLVVALVNWLATLLTTPHSLPRLDYSKGIPEDRRTLVVGPDHAEQRPGNRSPDQESGSPFSGQPGQKPAFRAADGFQRRCRGNAARRRLPDASGSARHRGLEQEAPKCDGRLFSTFSTGHDSSILRNGSGWATNESAASWRT